MTVDADALFEDDTLERLREAIRPTREVRGWATVELDRAERELLRGVPARPTADHAAPAPTPGTSARTDAILGANARRLELPGGELVVLLEPSIEGRLAAALARHGEGNLVRYLVAGQGAAALARAGGFQLTTDAPGPLGSERLVLGGPRQGPFVVIVEG